MVLLYGLFPAPHASPCLFCLPPACHHTRLPALAACHCLHALPLFTFCLYHACLFTFVYYPTFCPRLLPACTTPCLIPVCTLQWDRMTCLLPSPCAPYALLYLCLLLLLAAGLDSAGTGTGMGQEAASLPACLPACLYALPYACPLYSCLACAASYTFHPTTCLPPFSCLLSLSYSLYHACLLFFSHSPLQRLLPHVPYPSPCPAAAMYLPTILFPGWWWCEGFSGLVTYTQAFCLLRLLSALISIILFLPLLLIPLSLILSDPLGLNL